MIGKKVRSLMADAGIVRNKLKIASTISNAKAFLDVQKAIWQLRPLHLAVCRRKGKNQPLEIVAALAGANARIGCHEQGFEETRLPLRGLDDLLRLHASHRHGQRSLRRLHPPRKGVAVATTPTSATENLALLVVAIC